MSYVTQSLHRLVQTAANRPATVDGMCRRDWVTVETDVRRFAGALIRSGVRQGDRVAMLARNGDRYLDYVLAVLWIGAVINPVNIRWSAAEIAYSLEDCGTRILIVDGDFAPLIEAIRRDAPGLAMVVQIDGDPLPDAVILQDWLEGAVGPDDLRLGGEALAAILYTGGTTGRPKGVMLTHANLLASANGYLSFVGARPGRSYLHVAPLFHVGALSGMLTALLAGSTHVFLPAFEPGAVIETVERENVSDIFLVPTMLRAVLLHEQFESRRMAGLERVIYGASVIDDGLLDQAVKALPGAGFVQAYGMTELSPIATLLGPEDHSEAARADGRGRSAGLATAATEIRIVNPLDQEVPRGVAGEIVVRGGGVMRGYWGLPEVTATALAGGWMHTGDIGWMDAAGYVTIVDRLKDMIVTGGENVYSAEVENALCAHPGVGQAAVIGVPDERWGEAVHAFVVLADSSGPDVEALQSHCRSLIAGYKTPKSISFVEALPLSAAGKVLKTELRAIAQDQTGLSRRRPSEIGRLPSG